MRFLQSKGLYDGVDLQRFKRGLMDESKAQTLFEAMKSDGSLDADVDYDYWREYHNIPAAQKKSQAEIQAGLGAASRPSSPLSSGVDFTAPIQDVARQTAAIAEQQRPPAPRPAPQRPETAPRTFAGREIPAPVAPGREEQELVRQDVAAMQQMQANQLAQQRAEPIAQGRQVFGQTEADFPIKSADTAIKELEQARRERQKGVEVAPMFKDKNVPSYGKFFENTRMGRVLSQGGAIAGATARVFGAGALNVPELVANTIENISVDVAAAPLRQKLREGKITQEQFNTYVKSAREAAKKTQMALPVMTPRKLEYFADNFLNADELENDARKNLKAIQERVDNSDKGFEGLVKEGRVADAFQYAATQAIGSLPYALAAALPGGVYAIGGVAAQDKYRQIEDEVGSDNMNTAETLNAIGTGIIEGLSEAVTAGIVKRAGDLIEGVGKVAAQRTIWQQVKSLLKGTLGSMAEEGVSELAAQLAENIIDKATIKPDKDIKEGLVDALAITAVSGGLITGIAGTIGLSRNRQQPPTPPPPGAPTQPTGAAPTPPPPPGTPTQPAATPPAPGAQPSPRPFGPLGESAPDASVYADEILGNYRPEGGQMTQEEADKMVQDFLDTMLEVDEDEGDVKPPKAGTWAAEVYADVDARRQEIAQALMSLAATPKPTRQEAADQAAMQPEAQRPASPAEKFAQDIFDIYGTGVELTIEEANNMVDEYLTTLQTETESGTSFQGDYDAVLMNGDRIAEELVKLSKQPTDATQEVENVQPQGGERQRPGAQEVGQEAPAETNLGDSAIGGGMQAGAEVIAQERDAKVVDIESRRQDIISRKTTSQEKFEFLESIPEGTIFKNDDDGSAVIVSKKTTSRGTETYELTPIVFNEDTMQWEDNPAGVKIVEKKANGEFNLNAELPAIFTSQSSIIFPTDALYQRTLEALKPSVAPVTPTPLAPTSPVTNIEAPPAEPVQTPEGGLPEGFQQISEEEEAAQEREEVKLRRGLAQERRKAGRFTKGAVEYVRNPVDDTSPKGDTVPVYFTNAIKKPLTYKVVEAENLHPSHLGNKVNPMHFIPEAQPKDRTKGAGTVEAQAKIAYQPDVILLGQNSSAYSGAPIVNARNEVIQGNNRSAGMKMGYGSGSYGAYRQWLIDNAAQFGLDPERISAMKNPILVREANVSDDLAIELGQYTADDMESGGEKRIDSVALSYKMLDQDKAKIASIIYEDDLADTLTMKEVIGKKWKKLVPIISKYIGDKEKTFLIGRDGDISSEGKDSIVELFEQFLFDGADPDVKRIFKTTMPDRAIKAIKKSLRFIFAVPVDTSIIEDLQDAFLAYGAYKQRADEGGTKNFDLWLSNPTLFGDAPNTFFSPLVIELARRFHGMQNPKAREADLINVFKQYAALVTKEESPMFPSEREPLSKAEAVKQIFNVEYETTTEQQQAEAGGGIEPTGQQGITQLGAQQPTGTEMAQGQGVQGAAEAVAALPLSENIVVGETVGVDFEGEAEAQIPKISKVIDISIGGTTVQETVPSPPEDGPDGFESERDPAYWKYLYGHSSLTNSYDFVAVDIPGIKNKYKPSDTKVYHGTDVYEINENGDLVLMPSSNFEGKTNSVSFTQVPIVAQDYMLRKNGTYIIEINNEALGNRYSVESVEEIAINTLDPFIVPKGQFKIITVSRLADAKEREYDYYTSLAAEKILTEKSEIEALSDAYRSFTDAQNEGEIQENATGPEKERSPDWWESSVRLRKQVGDKIFEKLKDKISKQFIIDGIAKMAIERLKIDNKPVLYDNGLKTEAVAEFLGELDMYGSDTSPFFGDLFTSLLNHIGLTEELTRKGGARRNEYIEIVNSIIDKVENSGVVIAVSANPAPVQRTAPPAPTIQTGTSNNPHVRSIGGGKPNSKFLDASAVTEQEIQIFFAAGRNSIIKAKIKEQLAIAKKLQKVADLLDVKVYFARDGAFNKSGTAKVRAGVNVTSKASDSDPVQNAIYINLDKANASTLSHELAHAFFVRTWSKAQAKISNAAAKNASKKVEAQGKQLQKRLTQILEQSGDPELKRLSDDINRWSTQYPQALAGEEFVVELAARLSEGMRGKIVDNSILAKIERAINAFFDALLGKGQLQIRLTDTQDLIDFLNALSSGVADGDAQSIEEALEQYESGRVTNPRKTVYWKKQEIANGQEFVKALTTKINQQKFNAVKDIEAIANKILAQVFSPGRYVVKFNSAEDAAKFVENLNIGVKVDAKNDIKISKDVAADMAAAINDYVATITNQKQQIATDLTPEENADMERFAEKFPVSGGFTPEPTADETRVVEKLQEAQGKSIETYGKMIDAITVSPVANQDVIAGQPNEMKMRLIQERTGAIPNGLAGELTVDASPHGLYAMFETIINRIGAIRRESVSGLDAAKAIFALGFDGKAIHANLMFDKVRILDTALMATAKEAGKEYYMFDGSGAASLLLNSELGQTFLQDLGENRRNPEFEAQAGEIIALYGIEPTAFFNRVYAAQNAFNEGGIKAAEKSLNNNRSLAASIAGVGVLTKQEALNLENAIRDGVSARVATTGNNRLDSRADAMALALNMDKGLAREILHQLVGKHLTSPLDHNAVDDAIDLSDMEFYPQLSMLTESDYDTGLEIISEQRVGTGNMHNYTSQPYYDQAKDFVNRELTNGTRDRDIVNALSRMYPAHLTGFDAKNFFEGIAGRPFRSDVGIQDASAAIFKLLRHLARLEFGNAKMELKGVGEIARNTAYSIDSSVGNDLAPVRQIQRDLEKALRGLLPAESAAYQKMQLYVSASAFKVDQFTKRFYGEIKAMREGRFTDSFISRLTRSKVGSVNEFNTFLVNMHRWERIDRAIDIQEKFLANMYQELLDIATNNNITVQPIVGKIDPAIAMAQINGMLAQMNANRVKNRSARLKITRFNQETTQLLDAIALRDGQGGIIERFREYVKSKGINPAGLKPQDLETMSEFDDHFQFLREFKDMQVEYLDILLDAGMLNQERYDHLKNGTSGESDVQWMYYTPLVYDEFAFRDEMGFPPTSAEKKVATFKILNLSKLRRKRGNVNPVMKKKAITVGMLDLENLESPIEVFFHRMASAIKFRERNDALNALASMLEQTGSDKYATFSARYSVKKDRWGTVTSANDLIPDSLKKQSVTYYKDGKRRYLYFADPNDKMLAKLNRGFDDKSSLEAFFRPINNFARAAYTYLNPGFIQASLFRDVVEAATNIAVESRGLQINNFKAKLAKNFTKYYGKSSKFFLAPMFKKDPEMAQYFREMQELGGFMSWSFDSTELLRDAEAKVKDNIAYAEQYAQGRTKAEKVRTALGQSLEAIASFSNAIEMMPRLATYAALRQMNIDPVRAAEAAKNITVNFEKKGASNKIRQLSGLYLFLNPSIQGVRKVAKQLYTPEGRKYLFAYAAATAAARGLLYMMPYFAGDDEEEKDRIENSVNRYIYDKWASETKVLFPNPLDPANPLTIPKPYGGFRLAAAAGEGIVDMFSGKRTWLDIKWNLRTQIKGAFDPIAGTSSYTNQWIDAMPLPLLHPVFEAVANIDYQGRPILFDQSGSFDYLKANKSTAQIYHTIAQNVYRYTPGHMDFSPTSIEHIAESYFGIGPLRIVNNLAKAGENLADPESGKTDAERQSHFFKEILSANRVLYNPNISEDSKRDLYNYLGMAKTPFGSWNEEKVKYAERAIIVTKQQMLVNPKVIQDSLDDLLSQIVESGRLYQNVPGQEITWAQWYSAMSAIGDKRTQAQHRRYINDKISKALEESGNRRQE